MVIWATTWQSMNEIERFSFFGLAPLKVENNWHRLLRGRWKRNEICTTGIIRHRSGLGFIRRVGGLDFALRHKILPRLSAQTVFCTGVGVNIILLKIYSTNSERLILCKSRVTHTQSSEKRCSGCGINGLVSEVKNDGVCREIEAKNDLATIKQQLLRRSEILQKAASKDG